MDDPAMEGRRTAWTQSIPKLRRRRSSRARRLRTRVSSKCERFCLVRRAAEPVRTPALESQVAERFGRLEADFERRFEKLLQELHQRFEKACALLEAETAERRKALQSQHTQLSTRLEHAAQVLGAQKTSRDELASLLDDVANRLRAASGG